MPNSRFSSFPTYLPIEWPNSSPKSPSRCNSIVVLHPEVRDHVFPPQKTEGILQFHQLNEQVMLRVESCSAHGTLEIETQPFLYSAHPAALRKVEEKYKVKDNRRGEDAISTEEIDFNLHRVAEPTIDIDVV